MAVQIGKYKRNGIFTEYVDKSVFTAPTVSGINNLVIGVSKKGMINSPVLLNSLQDLEAHFGRIDRNLERKGSYFQRTLAKMLESGPVYALNLLKTNDNLDKAQFTSLSTTTQYDNRVGMEAPYRRFFDTTGFWKRDTDSFNFLAENEGSGGKETLLNFVNLSDTPITVFVVKSQMAGFNRSLLEWYGSKENIPSYLNETDYASDYMVDVIVVGGDWSNYEELSVDPKWSLYFNAEGLKKESLRAFANDRNVRLLDYYDGLSLIPYFRDSENNNIFIETVINRFTDRTGLFCAFNADLLETDEYNGLLDLVGETLVGGDQEEINFLSYKDKIVETVPYTMRPLDLPGNVVVSVFTDAGYEAQEHQFVETYAAGGNIPYDLSDRPESYNEKVSSYFYNGAVYNFDNYSALIVGDKVEINYDVNDNSFVVIGEDVYKLDVGSATINFDIEIDTDLIKTQPLKYAMVVGSNGVDILESYGSAYPSVNDDLIVLNYGEVKFLNDVKGDWNPTIIDVNDDGYKQLINGTGVDNDTWVVDSNNSIVGYNFASGAIGTIGAPGVTTLEDGDWVVYDGTTSTWSVNNNIIYDHDEKELASSNEFETTGAYHIDITETNDEVKIEFVGTNTAYSNRNYEQARLYKVFNAMRAVLEGNEKNYGVLAVGHTQADIIPLSDIDVIEVVTSGSANKSITISGISAEAKNNLSDLANAVNPYFALYKDNNYMFIDADIPNASYGVKAGHRSAIHLDYLNGVINNGDYFVDVDKNEKAYLFMDFDTAGNLTVKFRDEENAADYELGDVTDNSTLDVVSRLGNMKQTLEIETVVGYDSPSNKVLVNGARYTEVKVGDFLEYDYEAEFDEFGEEVDKPYRKYTRILSKRRFIGDESLVEITCDASIKKHTHTSGELFTTRYVAIDNYVSTYKGITMKGFKIREESLPDGSEARQNEILNLVAKGTPLFRALTNKESFDFRYLVDSFGLGLTERSKQQLVDIVGERLNSIAFINMPSLKQFKNSSSPSFVDEEGVLSMEYVAQGGNPESSPAFLYSFGDGEGATASGYFLPYVTINDNGRPMSFPPASFVATTYMRKFSSSVGSVVPWTIAAGVTNGRILGIAGVEEEFSNQDLEFLNQAKMNAIELKRTRGYVLHSESTALTEYKSSLSYIHSREVLIELERELSDMLLDYQWKFNTQEVRAEIKLKADIICETFVNRNGLYNYFNKIDEENNTQEIIDSQMGLLQTYVEVIKGMGIIVNEITILKTNDIASGGFMSNL